MAAARPPELGALEPEQRLTIQDQLSHRDLLPVGQRTPRTARTTRTKKLALSLEPLRSLLSFLPRQLRRQHVHLLDLRRLREQVARLRHQRRGDLAGKVSLPAGLVRERVEDAEG